MNQKGFIKAVVIILILLAVAAGYLYLKNPEVITNIFQKKSDETAGWKTYHNEEYGFELTLSDGYNGYNVSEERQYNSPGKILSFRIDARGTSWPQDRFPVFSIIVYPLDWWNENAQIESGSNGAYLEGVEQDMGSYLGSALTKSDQYAFAWGRSQDCPGSAHCALLGTAEDVVKTFRLIK